MTVIAVDKDPTTCTMRITAAFDAPVERVWQLWSDPRLLERWWGPPTYPATVDGYDLAPGGRVAYHMTGPEGDRPDTRAEPAPRHGGSRDALSTRRAGGMRRPARS
jgi:uncharacterized protein YndB with AHSA1/START domain